MIRVVAEAGSTNDEMAGWARAGAAEGDWLVARRQTAGRGRDGRTWNGAAGNLAASGLVRSRAADPPVPTLALVAGIAVADAVAQWLPAGRSARLKWPNDLLAKGAKLAGILIERQGDAAIVGVGINLAVAPPLADRATTSLSALGGATPDVAGGAETLARYFAQWLACWRDGGLAPIVSAWLARAHSPGTALRVQMKDGPIDGRFAGLTADGALRLRTDGGIDHVVHAGDVALR